MITIMPRTALGKWSLGLTGGLIIFFALLVLLAATGQTGGETFFSNLALAIPGLLAAACGIAAFCTALISIFRKKDYAILVFLTGFIGLLVLLFVAGELIYPH
jgi:hypothetical protein